MSKIDISPVLKAHFNTLSDNRFGGALSASDVALFFCLPAVVASVPLFWGFGFRLDAVSGFLNVFSVLTGLLLNLLVLVLTLTSNPTTTASLSVTDQRARKALLSQMFANVCFCVLIAVAVMCTALIALSYMRSIAGARTGMIATFLLSFLTMNFVLTLLMVIKRMYVLLNKEIDKGLPTQKAA